MIHAFRNIMRLNRIVTILVRYGFGWLVAELRIVPFFSFFKRVLTWGRPAKGLTTAERIRCVLEELGPTFIKLGQVASTRADIFPPDIIEELKKLQDAVPPVSFSEVKKVVERSLKMPLKKAFKDFQRKPVASASIAQVHYAVLHDGTEVAVKVKRPDIEEIIDADLSVMFFLAKLIYRHIPASRRYRPVEVVEEFSRVIHNELDLSIEGSNATIFARIFKDDPTVKIPAVYWEYTTQDVLTMERVGGIPLDEAERIREKGLDIKKIAENGIRAFFKQVFDHGIFHGDLHPGNIFTTDEGVIVYVDFGIVGRLDRRLRYYLATMLFHLVRQDYHRMALLHREMGLIGKDVDIFEFENALRDIAEPIFGKTLEEINISALLMKLIQTARRFRMKLQPNLLLLQRSMVIMEGVGRQIYPEINMWEVARPLIFRWMLKEKLSPGAYLEKGREFTDELTSTLFDLPGQFHSLLTTTLKDELKLGFIHYGLEDLSHSINTAGRSIATGLIIMALLLASTLVLVYEKGPSLMGVPYLSIAGFGLAFILGIRLALTGREKTWEIE